jgi:DNA-binding NarL/FixJ family response regulator
MRTYRSLESALHAREAAGTLAAASRRAVAATRVRSHALCARAERLRQRHVALLRAVRGTPAPHRPLRSDARAGRIARADLRSGAWSQAASPAADRGMARRTRRVRARAAARCAAGADAAAGDAPAGLASLPGGSGTPSHARPTPAMSSDDRARRLRVVLGEDSFVFREGLRAIVDSIDGLEVVGDAASEDEVLDAVEHLQPDVLITDIRMPPSQTDEGVRIARRLRDTRPEIGVVALSQFLDASWAMELLRGGVGGRAYLLKEHVACREQLAKAIAEVTRGGTWIDPLVLQRMFEAHRQAEVTPLAALTARQLEVLGLVAAGRSNAGIAADLGIGARAVERHVGEIFERLGLVDEADVSRRVLAALVFLHEHQPAAAP